MDWQCWLLLFIDHHLDHFSFGIYENHVKKNRHFAVVPGPTTFGPSINLRRSRNPLIFVAEFGTAKPFFSHLISQWMLRHCQHISLCNHISQLFVFVICHRVSDRFVGNRPSRSRVHSGVVSILSIYARHEDGVSSIFNFIRPNGIDDTFRNSNVRHRHWQCTIDFTSRRSCREYILRLAFGHSVTVEWMDLHKVKENGCARNGISWNDANENDSIQIATATQPHTATHMLQFCNK